MPEKWLHAGVFLNIEQQTKDIYFGFERHRGAKRKYRIAFRDDQFLPFDYFNAGRSKIDLITWDNNLRDKWAHFLDVDDSWRYGMKIKGVAARLAYLFEEWRRMNGVNPPPNERRVTEVGKRVNVIHSRNYNWDSSDDEGGDSDDGNDPNDRGRGTSRVDRREESEDEEQADIGNDTDRDSDDADDDYSRFNGSEGQNPSERKATQSHPAKTPQKAASTSPSSNKLPPMKIEDSEVWPAYNPRDYSSIRVPRRKWTTNNIENDARVKVEGTPDENVVRDEEDEWEEYDPNQYDEEHVWNPYNPEDYEGKIEENSIKGVEAEEENLYDAEDDDDMEPLDRGVYTLEIDGVEIVEVSNIGDGADGEEDDDADDLIITKVIKGKKSVLIDLIKEEYKVEEEEEDDDDDEVFIMDEEYNTPSPSTPTPSIRQQSNSPITQTPTRDPGNTLRTRSLPVDWVYLRSPPNSQTTSGHQTNSPTPSQPQTPTRTSLLQTPPPTISSASNQRAQAVSSTPTHAPRFAGLAIPPAPAFSFTEWNEKNRGAISTKK